MYSAPVMNPRKLPQFYNSPPGRANRRREIALAFQAAGRRDGIHSAGAVARKHRAAPHRDIIGLTSLRM